MFKIIKRLVSAVTVVVMVASMAVSANAYTAKDTWRATYIKGNSSTSNNVTAKCYQYAGGYQTYCSSINGSNDRYVKVYYPFDTNTYDYDKTFNITTTGYSTRKTAALNPNEDYIYFLFYAYGSSSCTANGTLGIYG